MTNDFLLIYMDGNGIVQFKTGGTAAEIPAADFDLIADIATIVFKKRQAQTTGAIILNQLRNN